jgi:ribosome-associated heat shock protein Hsp15
VAGRTGCKSKGQNALTELTGQCRLDVWLYRARLFKTRALAGHEITKGRFRITRFGATQRVRKPHFGVQSGDVVVFQKDETLHMLEVVDFGTRRGPASEARTLYRAIDETQDKDAD